MTSTTTNFINDTSVSCENEFNVKNQLFNYLINYLIKQLKLNNASEKSTITIRINRQVYEAFISACMDIFKVRPHKGINVVYEGLMRFIVENAGYLKQEIEENNSVNQTNNLVNNYVVFRKDWSFLKQMSTEELINRYNLLMHSNRADVSELAHVAHELKQRGIHPNTL